MPIIVDRNMDYRILQNIKNRFPQKNIIKSYRLSTVSGSLATHTDIQIHYLNWDTAVCAPECYEYYKSEPVSYTHLDVYKRQTQFQLVFPY